MHQICDMIAALFATTAHEKNVTIITQIAPNAEFFRGDERLLTLILKNLVDNAVKFTSNGSVTIRTLISTPDSSQNSPGLTQSPEFVLEVEDTGCGIPAEDQERVFERFYTVNRSRGGADRGTGLGLAIVKHAVNAMGGHVELASEPNQGTTIRCALPIK
jgi:signal transduction histidine kinase